MNTVSMLKKEMIKFCISSALCGAVILSAMIHLVTGDVTIVAMMVVSFILNGYLVRDLYRSILNLNNK